MRNYERASISPAVWRMKDGVDMGSLHDVTFARVDRHFTFTWTEDGYTVTVVFSDFLFTKVDVPWK